MKVDLCNVLNVDITDDVLLQIILDELTYDNPLYKEAVNSFRSTRGIQPVIKNLTYSNGLYQLPRGYFSRLESITTDLGIPLDITDSRAIAPLPASYSHNIHLREYQMPAIMALAQCTDGVLVAPAGSGKTIIGIATILMCGQRCLWVTHTKQLLFQFVDRIKKFVNIPESDIGLIYDGKWDTDKPITAALVQTLKTNLPKVSEISHNYGTVITDECLIDGTKILLLDGTEKIIEEINNDDVTNYGKISYKFCRSTNKTIKLRTGVGELEGTYTHILPVISKEKETIGKDNKFKSFLSSDVELKSLENINNGDYLLHMLSSQHVQKSTISIEKARLLALIACDGHITKNLSCLQIGVAKDKNWFSKEMLSCKNIFYDSNIKFSKCKRGDLIIREYSKEAIKFVNNYVPEGKKSNIITVPNIIKEASLDAISNYLQVVFDAEGSVTNRISLTMSSSEYIKDIQFLLKKFNIIGRMIPIKRNNYLRIEISGYDTLLFFKKIGFSIKRKQKSLENLLKNTRTFIRTVSFKNVLYRCMPVIEKKYFNTTKTVHDFTTEEHFFIANGILSSNCHHQPSTTFTDVIARLKPYYLFGLTATPKRRDGLETVLYQNIGPIRYTIPRTAVASGILTPVVHAKHIDTQVLPNETSYQNLLKLLVKDNVRNNIIANDVVDQAAQGNICIVVTERVPHAEALFKKIQKKWPKTGIMVGKHSDKLRDTTLEALHSGAVTVLVCTSHLLGEGFDYAPLNRLFITLPIRNQTRVEQLVGRVQRISEGKIDAIIFDYVDNHGLTKHQYRNLGDKGCRYNVYRKLGCKVV